MAEESTTFPLLSSYTIGKFDMSNRLPLIAYSPCAREPSSNSACSGPSFNQFSVLIPSFLLIAEATGLCHIVLTVVGFQPSGPAPVSSTDKLLLPQTGSQECNRSRYIVPSVHGFDGVVIHVACGYLIDQFMKDQVNDRTDEYGRSLENHCQFTLEILQAVVDEIGPDKVRIRLALFESYHKAGDSDQNALGLYMAESLNRYRIAHCHVVEPRMKTVGKISKCLHSLLPMRKAFEGTFIVAGGYTQEDGIAVIAEGRADLVAFGESGPA